MTINKIKMLFILILLINGCSYGLPLETTYKSPQTNTYLKAIKPNTINIKIFNDKRNTNDFHTVGIINEVVADISSDSLILDKDVSTLVTGALQK